MYRFKLTTCVAGAAAAFLLLSAPLVLAAESGPVVGTTHGQVRGEQVGDIAVFRGIPYAAPPVGELRWRPPAPADAWEGIRKATRPGPDCPQPAPDNALQSEDCLTLNVVAPRHREDRLPVLVVIHGGAFFVGSGRAVLEPLPIELIDRGMVLVAPNYRIGRLGFFAHPAQQTDGQNGAVGNYWLMDQVAALKWVQQNIGRFGGDPGNVTILGCSAGGSSVNALMASPAARGLFHKASARSGGGLFNATRSRAVAERLTEEFAARAGASGTDSSAMEELRSLSAPRVLAGDTGPPDFGAIVDGVMLTQPTSLTFARGDVAPVPYMAGSTSNEASVFGLMGFNREVLRNRFGIDLEQIRPAYEGTDPLSDSELLRQVQTDFIFTSAAFALSTFVARGGLPAFGYYFDYVPPERRELQPGANHCADMRYLFANTQGLSGSEKKIARMLQQYLINFMVSGNPNGSGLPSWPSAREASGDTLIIGEDTRAVDDFRHDQLQVWLEKWHTETGAASFRSEP
jgi:para-nitrobenzyl esterase